MLRTQGADRAAIARFAEQAQWSDEEGGGADEYNDEYDDSFDDLQGGAVDGVADVEGAWRVCAVTNLDLNLDLMTDLPGGAAGGVANVEGAFWAFGLRL